VNIYTITGNILDEWHWVEPELAKAKARTLNSRQTTGHYLVDILNKQAFVMVVKYDSGKLGCICLIYVNPDTLHVESWSGSGMKDWLNEALEQIYSYARDANVKYITSKSRPGAAKVLKRAGWKIQDYYMRAEVI